MWWPEDLAPIKRCSVICWDLSLPTVLPKNKLSLRPFYRCKCAPLLLVLYSQKVVANFNSVAGTDTTATVIRATMLYLIMNPRVVSKLRAEFQPHPSPITDAVARKLPYLQAVINESLRIFPPVVGLMSKEVPPAGDVIDGKFVPGGTKIGFGAYGIYRNKAIWGDDADSFRPERWLEVSSEKLKEMESTLELVFSYGKYKCLGKDIAMMELNKIFVEASRETPSCSHCSFEAD